MTEIEIIEYKNTMQGMVELALPHAKAVRAYYLALVDEGFSVTQALQLTIHHGYMPPLPRSNEDE